MIKTLITFLSISYSLAIASEPIRIGYIDALTPDKLGDANKSLNTVKLLVAEQNRKGGVRNRKIEIITFDTKDSPTHAGTLKKEIQSKKLTAVLGINNNDQELFMVPFLDALHLPTIVTGASDAHALNDTHYIAETIYNDRTEGAALANKLKSLGKSSVIVAVNISNTSAINEAKYFSMEFERIGGKVLNTHKIDIKNIPFSQIAQNIRREASQADAILVSARTLEILYFWIFMKKAKIDLPLVTSASLLYTNLDLTLTHFKDDFEVYLFPSWDAITQMRLKKSFFDNYEKVYHEKLTYSDIGPVMTHDSLKILFSALQTAKSLNPDDLIQAIKSTKFDGLSGRVSYSKEGYNTATPVFYQYKQGQFFYVN